MIEGILAGKSAGVAKISSPAGHSGMGILVGRRRVLTCAHVVNDALGRDLGSPVRPDAGDRVVVTFPLVDGVAPIQASVVAWSPPATGDPEDVALLMLEQDAPAEAGIAVLVDVKGIDLDGDSLSVYGFAGNHPVGRYIDARLMGSSAGGRTQIDGTSLAGAAIQPGFSGAGVWDAAHRGVVGMVVARLIPSGSERIAFMIPTADLCRLDDKLPFEERHLSPNFQRCWTILASLMLFVSIVHVGASQGSKVLMRLSLGGESTLLAAFWGMHLLGVLMAIVFAMLLAFASSFRERDWWRRVPAFGSMSAIPQPSMRRLTAILGLVFLVAWPLYAEGHLLKRFHEDGRVYITPATFGWSAAGLMAEGQTCDVRSVHYCTHPDAGLYSLVSPRVLDGDTEPAPGGYFDNAYQYGNRENGGSDAFFPILQPLIVDGLYALSILLAGWSLLVILRPTRRNW